MKNSIQQSPLSRYLTVTNVLIAICVLVFIGQSQSLLNGGELYFSKNPYFEPWQYITYMFMHGGTNHLLFNMFGLWMFGSTLEKVWGAKRFLFFYLACGVGAAFIYIQINQYQFGQLLETMLPQLSTLGMTSDEAMQMLAEGNYLPSIPMTKEAVEIFATPMVGASGAIYGILVAFAILFPMTGFSLFGGNIAHFAHIGGAVIGALLTFIWYQRVQLQKQQSFSQQGMWRE